MKLMFQKIKIHNFLSFVDQEFDFSVQRGLTLICGKNLDIGEDTKNGAGKSSLFLALLYGMFGQLQYPIKNQSLRNHFVNSKEMSVDVWFKAAGDKRYHICRSLTGGQSKIVFDEIDDQDNVIQNFNRSSIAETDEFIQKEIINCDISMFLRTIFLSSDQNYDFFKLTPAAKREFIEKLFDTSVFGSMYSLMHRDLLKLDKDIMARQSKLTVLNKNEEQYKQKIEEFDKTKNAALDNFKKTLKSLDENYSKLLNESVAEVDNAKVTELESNISSLESEKTDLRIKQQKLRTEYNKLFSAKAQFSANIESKTKIISGYDSILNKLCNDCRPILKQYYNLDSMSEEIEQFSKKLTLIDQKIDSDTKKINQIDKEINEIATKTDSMNLEIHSMTDSVLKSKMKLNQLQNQINSNKMMLESKMNEKNPFVAMFDENHSLIENENAEIGSMMTKYNYLKFVENIVSTDSLKKLIIKDLVVLLNNKLKYYLSRLGADFECKFDENMNVEFTTAGGSWEYANFSAGERARLMIAACFSFKDFMHTRNNFNSNILILDEFIDNAIDGVAINGVMGILQDFKKLDGQSIYVISHRTGEIDNSMFDSILQVEKQNHTSTVKYLNNEK